MFFFTKEEFLRKYADECSDFTLKNSDIESACLMIFSQVGLKYRDYSWNTESVPKPIKDASMEQLRFLLVHDIPFLDTNKFDVDGMRAELDSTISKKALLILSNSEINYLDRGSPCNSNMLINIGFNN